MSKLETLVSELQEISKNPRKAMEDFKAAGGKGAVGILPVYAPEEIVYAAGYLPMGIWGAQKQNISKARAYLPPFACSIMQSIMELELNGTYDDLAAILISVPCDTLKCISQKWKGKSPVIVFAHPQNRNLEAANVFLVEEYKIVREKLEKILGVTITDDALMKAIKVYNENRKVMREFSEVAAKYPQSIDPIKRHAIIKSRFFMDKAKHTEKVKEIIAELNAMPAEAWDGKKVLLTGIMAEPDDLLDILKEFKIAVVADDLAQENRQFRVDAPEEGDPLYCLAKWWQNLEGCSLATDRDKKRGAMMIDAVKKSGADAVIVCMMKFCDPEEYDYPIYYQEFEKAEIKSLMIEIDQESQSFEQAKTRIQSFVEMM